MYEILIKLIEFVESLGYLGIFLMTFIEGTFVPIPSEFTLIPAGYLAAQKQMNLYLVLICGGAGMIGGAVCGYWIAYKAGRPFVARYGKYIGLTESKLKHVECFFKKYGVISISIGRVLPGIKHFISLPAGLAQMNFKQFTFYSAISCMIWVVIVVGIGKVIGDNSKLIEQYLRDLNLILCCGVILIIVFYFWKRNDSR